MPPVYCDGGRACTRSAARWTVILQSHRTNRQWSQPELASFSGARLRNVSFHGVNLTEASFQEARLENVRFIDCELTGADFRGARCAGGLIRGASLNGVIGVEGLRGVAMVWSDVVASAGALAAALGIEIADDD